MSYPYPQNRHIDRINKGDQPYKDAKESMAQEQAELQDRAEEYGETRLRGQEEREMEAEERLAEINRDIQEEHGTA